MPAPAAPRKKGALTSSTAPRISTRNASANSSTARAAERGVEADLANRLEQVSLNNASAARKTAASTSRLQRTASSSSKVSPAPSRLGASSRIATPPASLETLFASVNNTLSQLSAKRKSASLPCSADINFLKAIKDEVASLNESLIRLRSLGASTETTTHDLPGSRLLSIERAAILLVSLCIDANLLDTAVQQLSLIRQSLIRIYVSEQSPDGPETLAAQFQNFKLGSSRSRPVSRSASTISGNGTPFNAPSRGIFKASFRDTAKLLAFPPIPQVWDCQFSATEVCTSILIVQNQILTCLYGLTEASPDRPSRTSTSMSTTSRVRSSTSSVNEVEDYSIASAILEALEVEGGDPLGIFRKAAEHMQPSERSKTEHYIAAIYSLIMKRTSELAVNGSGPPLAILKLQLYAIECLLENSSYFATPASTAGSVTTDDKSVTSLAGNLNRALISFGKMSTANGIPEAELASQISQKVLPLIRRIREVIRPEERLLVSKAYLELTNLLVQLFDKGSIDATTLLQHCQPSSLKSSDPSMALETSSPSETVAEVDMEREALHLNSILTTQVTCLEQWISSGCSSLRIDGDAMQDALKSAAKFLRLDVQSTTDTKIRKSITRNLERMHHFAYRAYKDWHKESEGGLHAKADIIETNPTLRELLSSFCVTVEVARGPPELLARAVDTLLLFARLDFRLHEPVTYKQVHQNIERCIALLDSADPPSLQDSRLFGTLASSAYSIGRALYNAEKHANAVPFLRNSCTSTDRMIDMSKNANSSISLADLLDKSASRWELLGSAYTHCQEKEDALKSYSACLHMLHQQRQEGSATELLLDSTFMRVLAKYTKLSILDLLMDPETACIAERLSSMSTSQAGNLIKAQILDAHSLCLQEYLHKPEAVLASTYWLDAAIVAYDTCARNSDLARRMFLAVGHGQEGRVNNVQTLKERLSSLYDSENPTPWAAESLASAKLLSALHTIQQRDTFASKTLAKEAKEALGILRNCIVGGVSAAATSGARITPIKSPAQAAAGRILVPPGKKPSSAAPPVTVRITTAPRKPLSPKNNVSQPPKGTITPPRRQKKGCDDGHYPLERYRTTTADGDLSERLRTSRESLALLDTVACVLGIYEHTFLRISYLRFVKAITQGRLLEQFTLVCLDLAYEYQQLGKSGRVEAMFAQAEAAASNPDVNAETRILLLLRKAEHISSTGRANESDTEYRRALTLWESILPDEEANKSSSERILCRTRLLYRTAQAASCFTSLAENKGEFYEAISASMQTLRLCNRALANLSRLSTVVSKDRSTKQGTEPMGHRLDTLQGRSSSVDRMPSCNASHAQAALGWRITQLLGQTLLRSAQLYQTRGTVKTAAYFYQQATELAESLGAPRLKAKILAKHTILDRDLGNVGSVRDKLAKLSEIAGKEGGLSTVDVLHLNAQTSVGQGDFETAEKTFKNALSSLNKLDKAFGDTDGEFPSPIKNSSIDLSPVTANEAVLPSMRGEILQQYIAMMSASGQSDQARIWLDQLTPVKGGTPCRLESSILITKLRLSEILMNIRQDPVAGLLRESVLSMPLLLSPSQQGSLASSAHFAAALCEVELELLGNAVAYYLVANPQRWRQLSGAIAQLRMLQASMGRFDAISAIGVASALQSGTAVTARREMVEVLHQKLTHGILRDDLIWPHAQPRLTNSKALSAHWQQIEDRYKRMTSTAILEFDGIGSLLPDEWSILSLHVTPDALSLLAVLHTRDNQPLILQLPFDRVSRREGDDTIFDLHAARQEMAEIVSSANATSQNAKYVTTPEDRRSWWGERKALDRRLAALLVDIEKKWLGSFKNIVEQKSETTTDGARLSTRYSKLLALVTKIVHSSHNQKAAQLQLNPALVTMFYKLPSDADDDELEDWLHFIVDSLQFAGVRVAYDEIDLDQAVVDLRSLLEERCEDDMPSMPMSPSSSDSHLFLILDKGLHSFPWESLPCLANSSVSRLPSLDYLRDRLQLRNYKSYKDNSSYPGLTVDGRKLFYLLNPGGDLLHTQREFHDLLQAKKWAGIVGKAPMEEEMRRQLSTQDLFLYLGHGGAEQYIRPHVLQALPSCASTLLWGCSSGHLKDQGEFEETGTPLVYMQAGAPAVVGNLWDVTDKDLDRFTHSALEKFGLLGGESNGVLSLPSAVAASRSSCSLRYLNGAAPVVWGIPVKIAERATPAPS